MLPYLCSLQFVIQLSEIQLRDKDFCKFAVKIVIRNKSIQDVLAVDWLKKTKQNKKNKTKQKKQKRIKRTHFTRNHHVL